MKLELKINLAQFEMLGITTNEYNSGLHEADKECCIDEMISILKLHQPYFPKQISHYLEKYESMKKDMIK